MDFFKNLKIGARLGVAFALTLALINMTSEVRNDA